MPSYTVNASDGTVSTANPSTAQLVIIQAGQMALALPSSVANLHPADFTITTPNFTIPPFNGNWYIDVNQTTPGPTTVTLPANTAVLPGTPRVIYIKDMKGDAATNNITLVGAIDNNGNGLMRDNLSLMRLVDTGTYWRRS